MFRLLAFSSVVLALAATLAVAQGRTGPEQTSPSETKSTPATQPKPAAPQSGTAQAPGRPEDRSAIRRMADQYAAGWNEGNANKATAIFTTNAIFVGDDGQVHKGRAAIEKDLAQALGGPMKGTSFKVTVDGVGFLKPDVAIAYGTSQVESAPNGANKGHYVVTCVKAGGSWKAVALGTGLDATH